LPERRRRWDAATHARSRCRSRPRGRERPRRLTEGERVRQGRKDHRPERNVDSVDGRGDHDLICKITDGSARLGRPARTSITAITDGAISIHGDRDTTCTRGASSPKLGDYKLGDRVMIGCTNGVLAGIVRTS
jgi:hypothetical protein